MYQVCTKYVHKSCQQGEIRRCSSDRSGRTAFGALRFDGRFRYEGCAHDGAQVFRARSERGYSTEQYDTIRQLRTAYSNMYRASIHHLGMTIYTKERKKLHAVHKAEDGRATRELSSNHMYLLAPMSNNKLVVIPYPRLSLEGLEEPAKLYLPGIAPVEREDGIIIMNLLSLECTEGRLWDVYYLEKLWWKYFQGHMDDALTSLGMSSPRMKEK